MKALTIYECPKHGQQHTDGRIHVCPVRVNRSGSYTPCAQQLVPVRVFREEDVRPLWEAARDIALPPYALSRAVDAFPAPEEWKDDDPWVCEKCGQRLASPASLCNSGIHVGPGDGEEAQGEAVRLSDSRFEQVTVVDAKCEES